MSGLSAAQVSTEATQQKKINSKTVFTSVGVSECVIFDTFGPQQEETQGWQQLILPVSSGYLQP